MIGKNIYLRAVEPEDLDLFYQWENDYDIWQYSRRVIPLSRFTLTKYMKTANEDIFQTGQQRLIIVAKETDAPVGAVDLFDFDPIESRAAIGILIYDETERQKGFATEAVRLLEAYAFGPLRLHQLYCDVAEDNDASIKLFSGLGYIHTCTKKEWLNDGYRWKDELLFQKINPGDISK